MAALAHASHPALIAAVGALFALSFDTVSQALFSLTASSMSGWGFSILLGATFMLGMMDTDGVSGLWVAKLRARGGGDHRLEPCASLRPRGPPPT